MEPWVLIGLLIILWCVGAPIFGLIAFTRIGALKREIEALRGAAAAPEAAPAAAPKPKQQTRLMPVTPPPGRRDESALPAAPAGAGRLTPPPRPPGLEPAKPKRDWEKLIAANWIVWVGGLALALGGLFLVRVAIDAGLFGPEARTIMAAVLGAALCAASLRAGRWKLVSEAENALKHLPSILAGAGVLALYGAALASGALYHFVSPTIAFGLFLLISTLAVWLAMKHGPVIAAIGIAGAYAAPLMTGAEGGSPLYILPYAAAATGAGLTLIRLMRWRYLVWLCLAGTAFWGLVGLGEARAAVAWSVPAYAIACAAMALFFAEPAAREPIKLALPVMATLRRLRARSESLFAAYVFWALAGVLIIISAVDWQASLYAGLAMAAFGGLSLFAASQREGFSLTVPLASIAALTGLILWPDFREGQAAACFAVAAGFGVIGWFVMPRLTVQAPVAATAALTPPAALFVAFWRGSELQPGFLWGFGALLLASALGMALDRLELRDKGFKAHPGVGASYAVGTALSAALAPFLMLSGLWLGPAMAVVALSLAFAHRRFALNVLTFAGMGAAGLSVALLIRPGMLNGAQISAVPVFNELTFAFGIAIASLIGGAYFLKEKAAARRAYGAAAAATSFALVGLLIRHASGGGSLDGPYGGFGEASGYAIAYLGLAVTVAWRYRKRALFWRIVEYVGLAAGMIGVLAALGALEWDAASGVPLLNLLLPAFAMPALLLTAYSYALRRADRFPHAWIAGGTGIALGLVWVTAETRRMFTGAELAGPPAGDAEMWAYSVVWILYAFALLGWGVWREQRLTRFASLAVLALALIKVFTVDLGALDGVVRALSFLGLGGALIGVALFYQRFVFGGSEGSRPAESSV